MVPRQIIEPQDQSEIANAELCGVRGGCDEEDDLYSGSRDRNGRQRRDGRRYPAPELLCPSAGGGAGSVQLDRPLCRPQPWLSVGFGHQQSDRSVGHLWRRAAWLQLAERPLGVWRRNRSATVGRRRYQRAIPVL